MPADRSHGVFILKVPSGALIPEGAPFLDDGRHEIRNSRLPAAVVALQASQHVGRTDLQNRRIVALERFDAPVVEEELIEVPQRR